MAVVIPILVKYQLNTSASNLKGDNGILSAENFETFNDNSKPSIGVIAQVSSLNVIDNLVKVTFALFPLGSLSRNATTLNDLQQIIDPFHASALLTIPSTNANISLAGTTIALKTGVPTGAQTLSLPLNSGDSSLYPFDDYAIQFDILSINGTSGQFLPILVYTESFLPLFNIKSSFISSDPSGADVVLSINITRSKTSKAFAFFVIVNMWILTCSLLALTCGFWLRGKKVELAILGSNFTLLFALPNGKN